MRQQQDGGAPWRPMASSWATLFLFPLAGGLVTAVNLLRMSRPDKAAFAFLIGLASLFFMLLLWSISSISDDYVRISYIVVALGDVGLFLYLQREDYGKWLAAHPHDQPASGWSAAAWALFGFSAMIMVVVVWVIVAFFLFTPDSGLTLLFNLRA